MVLPVAGHRAFGWALVAAAITPIGDAIIVTTNGGSLRHALSIHGATALVLVAAGLVLALAQVVDRPWRTSPRRQGGRRFDHDDS